SIPLLLADLIALHSGAGATLEPAPPLREHAAWLATRDAEASGRAWAQALDGLTPMPMIGPPAPSDVDMPTVGEARLDAAATDALIAWARSKGLTLNTVLQLAWGRILSGLTGRDDVVFGQTTSGRDAALPNSDRLVGALVTTIPVRVRLDDRSPAEVGALLQRTVARLRSHEYLGIAEITRHAGAGQLFDTLLVFENSPTGDVTAPMPLGRGAAMTVRRVDSPSHYPLAVVPVLDRGELICRVETRPDQVPIFDPDRMARRMLAVAERITAAARCCDIDVLLGDEPAELTSAAAAAPEFETVPGALLAAADTAAGQIAVIDAAGDHTFAEFGSAVRRLADELRAAGVGPGDAVAVMLPRDRRVLHAPFAIGHIGACCVHVDPATPADRVAYLLRVSGARIVLADSGHAEVIAQVRGQDIAVVHGVTDGNGHLEVDCPTTTSEQPVGADRGESESRSLAPFYVVFTSGTTGRPKGVAVPDRAVLNHWGNHERRIFAPAAAAAGRPLRIGHGWSTGFDAAWQPTVALLSGHTVVMLGDEVRTDAERIVAAVDEFGIDIFDTSPSMLNRLIAAGLLRTEQGVQSCPLAVLALGGEAISPDTWRRLRALPSTRVINFYGPTETTVEALLADVHDHAYPTIGYPFDGMSAQVLDHRLRPVPPGGQGELYLAGPQLALGYLRRPSATAGAFVAAANGERRYRTGDLVRRSDDGTLAYEGRIDSQVKINGYRVEPDEVSVVLRELDGVRQAAALAFADNGRMRLGALIVGDRPVGEIRSELARRLPQFLVPTRIVAVDELPLNRNGKLDGHAATALLARPVATGAAAEPATDTERTLLSVMAEMSAGAQQRIGILDSLIDLGIDSIGVIDLVSRLRGRGFRISARAVPAAADLRDLAHRLDNPVDEPDTPAAPVAGPGTALPLTPLAHEILGYGGYRYLAQSQVLSLPADATADSVVARLEELATAHPALRSRPATGPDGRRVLIVGERCGIADTLVVGEDAASDRARTGSATRSLSATRYLEDTVRRLDPDAGRMVAATVLPGPRPRLLLSIHHLAVDVVSWLILADDLRNLEAGRPLLNEAPAEADSRPCAEVPRTVGVALGDRHTDPMTDRAGDSVQRLVDLGPERTADLLRQCSETGAALEDLLLMTCARLVADTAGDSGVVAVTRESHGRAPDDRSRRVGWFTVEETVLIPAAELDTWTAATPAPVGERTPVARGQIRLNHLGRFDVLNFGDGPWAPAPLTDLSDEFGIAVHPELPLRFTIDVNTAVVLRDSRPSLVAHLDFNTAVLDASAVDARTRTWQRALSDLATVAARCGHDAVPKRDPMTDQSTTWTGRQG
ncbi:MAG: AMP-binding protein, partial [Nocardia sp.]|nr:AMP-binding protein [Nocardia sp.]